ncbi:MAG: DNA mismatch repair protein MutS [Planctomycetota bacterium]|jgi:DNA mismatch repair protein MutS
MMMKNTTEQTPMMKQYHSFKERCKDSVLFFRMGDFYEMFYEDAKIASRVLGIALTSRSKGEKAVPMAGVPHHAAGPYIRRLLQAGHKVAICDQVQDPSEAKGVVDRDITRVITPGTLTDENLLDDRASNYLACILPGREMAGLSWVELSTGRFEVEDIPPSMVLDQLHRLRPSECLIPEDARDSALVADLNAGLDVTLTRRPAWEFSKDTAYKTLTEHFGTSSLEGFGCEALGPAIGAGGAIMQYLKETQNGSLSHIAKLQRFSSQDSVLIDAITRRGLELTETARTRQTEGSLLWVLDRTRTPMGARLIKEWILFPLLSPDRIRSRHQAVGELHADHTLRENLRPLLKEISDIERISTRISSGRSNARDLVSLKNSLDVVPRLKEALAAVKASELLSVGGGLEDLEEVRVPVSTALVDSPPQTVREGGMIREGYSPELDELRSIRRNGKEWIARYQADEIKRSGIASLKVNFNRVFGYYIEITNAYKDRVPQEYIRKQTLKNAERYITPELKDYESRVLTADERAKELEHQIFERIRSEVAGYTLRLQRVAGNVARLDVLLSLAQVAAENGYVRPEICDGTELLVEEGRHPVLEKTMGKGSFVPNDVEMDETSTKVMVITGPNMAGKSTYIRQVALLLLMAQMGSFVPAKKATIGVVDRVFTRIGASDELHRGQSTFMVEMQEAANILNNATARSLIILDEIGRGTSTFDGLSIAWAMTEYIYKNVGARTLFATHYHELTGLAELLPGVKNFNVAVKEWGDDVIFLRKIVAGGSDKSYGIHVARLAGIPREVVKKAGQILEQLEANALDVYQRPRLGLVSAKETENIQLSLFAPKGQAVVDDLQALDITALTPIEALNKLNEYKEKLGRPEETEA